MIVIMMVVSFGLMISINPFDLLSVHDLNRKSYAMTYQTNMQIIMKLTVVLISCYLFGSSFCHHQDQYGVLILSYHHQRKNRILYFLTKFYALGSIVIGFCLFCFISYGVLGYLFSNWFIVEKQIFSFLVILILCGLTYGAMAGVLALITNNWFSSLIPYVIFLVSDFMNEYARGSTFNKIFSFFFPTMVSKSGEVYLAFGIPQVIMLFLSLIIFGTIIFMCKDFS